MWVRKPVEAATEAADHLRLNAFERRKTNLANMGPVIALAGIFDVDMAHGPAHCSERGAQLPPGQCEKRPTKRDAVIENSG